MQSASDIFTNCTPSDSATTGYVTNNYVLGVPRNETSNNFFADSLNVSASKSKMISNVYLKI